MSFDPTQFMNAAVDPMATQMEVIPEGEYPFMLDSDPKMLLPKNIKGTSQKTGEPYDFWQIELNAICIDEAVKAKLGRKTVSTRMRLNIDIDAQTGSLQTGPNKNVSLGRLRDALGQNQPGWTPSKLLGAGPFIGKVEHTRVKDATYADISRVSRLT